MVWTRCLIAHGTLTDQETAQRSIDETLEELNINFLSVVSILTPLANYFEQQRRGNIAVISSVAGDRGRMSNYIYGTAKAGVTTYLQGLRARMQKCNVAVLTVKPGFVDTPMTAHLKKNPLYASPVSVGKSVYEGMKAGKDTIYTPFFWRFIMLIIIAMCRSLSLNAPSSKPNLKKEFKKPALPNDVGFCCF